MVKSNINDWVVCQPNGGSIVEEKSGSVSCQNIKNVMTVCSGAPKVIYWWSIGPALRSTSFFSYDYYYFFEGNTGKKWPMNDPCGKSDPNHKESETLVDKSIFVRNTTLTFISLIYIYLYTLFWNVHMDNLSKKVPSGTGALKHIRPFVNSNTLQMIL